MPQHPTTDALDPELASFRKNGFLGPFKVYEPDEAKQLLARIRTNNVDRSHILFDNDVNYDRHFDIPELTRHVGQLAIVDKVRKILGPDVFCWRSEFFPKFPGAKATEWHQVSNYQYATGTPMLRPTLELADVPLDLTVWTAFTDATRENGCMKFLPGSHTKLYYDESKEPKAGRSGDYASVKSGTAFFGYDFQDFKVDPAWMPDEDQAVAMEMKPGEAVLFTARCVHASYPNTSKRSTRFAITARYTPTHVRVYADMPTFHAHGGDFDLSRYGVVLVSGEDRYGHNRVRDTSNRGERFAHHLAPAGLHPLAASAP